MQLTILIKNRKVEKEEKDILDAPPEALTVDSLSPAWEARLCPSPGSSPSAMCFSLHGENMETKNYNGSLAAKQTWALGNPGGFSHRRLL